MQNTQKKPYKKRRYSRKYSTTALVKKTVASELRRQSEIKFYDEAYTIATMDINGSLNAIAEMAQGVTINERVGDKVTATSVQFNIRMFSPGLATTAPFNTTRITLFIWYGPSTPTILDLFQVNTINFSVLSPFKWETRKQRKILHDEIIDQYYVATNNYAENPSLTKKIYCPLPTKNRKNEILFDAAGNTNMIYAFVISNNNGAANTTWTANVYSRVNYIDM